MKGSDFSQITIACMHSFGKFCTFITALFLFYLDGYSQKTGLAFEHFTNLSAYVVPCVLQDSVGYLWFGTYGGLDRFDGYNFTSFENDPGNPNSINNGAVQSLYEDREGNLWIGTSRGLDKMDRNHNKFIHYFPYPPNSGTTFSNYILSICEDRFGALWIGTGNGLNRFDKSSGEFVHFLHDSADDRSIGNNFVHAVYEDNSGSLWFGTGNGLDKLDRKTGKFIHYWHDPENTGGTVQILWNNSIDYTSTYQINFIYEDKAGMLWLCTNGRGLIEFNTKTGVYTAFTHHIKDPESISGDQIQSVCQDEKGTLWIATRWSGANSMNLQTKKFIRYVHDDNDPGSLSINLTVSVLCERSGTIWITSYNGLNKLNRAQQPFIRYTHIRQNTHHGPVRIDVDNLVKSRDDKIWIETDTGWELFDPNVNTFTFTSFEPYNLLAEDRRGNLWLTKNSGGIYRREQNGSITRFYDISGKEFRQHVNCVFISPNDDDVVWLGTIEDGIFLLDQQNSAVTLMLSAGTSIKTIYQDTFGMLWAGTKDGGLLQFDPASNKKVRYISDVTDTTSISGNNIITIFEDKKKNIWLGTNVGLNRYDREKGSFVHITDKDGLLSNLIMAIEEDSHGNLWISSSKGISKLNPGTGKVRNYDISYGLGPNPFFLNMRCQTNNGEIFFGGPGGLTRFHPDSIRDNLYIPPVQIIDFRVNDKDIPFGKEIHLSHSNNFISFEFAALSYVSPERNQYKYKLEGVDRDWVWAGTRRYASYPDLRPGDYVFRVKGSNNDGVWNEASTSIKIVIAPPWWRTIFAYVSYIILLAVFLYYLRHYELNRISLKNQVKQKEETNKIKSRFFANISHEFRTPLTLILGPAEKILSASREENSIKDAGIIRRNSARLLQLVNQLLDLSKLEAGKLTLGCSKGNIVSLVKSVALSFESLAESKDITLMIISRKEYIELYFDKDKMYKILSNLLSNAFKYTPQNGKITVAINESGTNTVHIKIRDSGMGIASEEILNIFDRFYQVDSSFTKEYEGTGIGLALTKELVELQHGNIYVESTKGDPGWTEFTISLPTGRAHLKEEDILVQTNGESDKKAEESAIHWNEFYNFPSKLKTKETKDIDGLEIPEKEKLILLIVEDNYEMRDYIKDCLIGNYLIEEAINGEQGIRKAEAIIPDLIISDVMMPKMDGNELTNILKNNEKTSHIPIILLTAKSGQDSKIEGLKSGADDYLTKPFDLKELQIRIENLITIRKKLQERIGKSDLIIKPEVKNLRSIDEKFINKVIKVIEEHISDEAFNIEEFADQIGMSRVQLHRKLKALAGKSASLYIRSVRLAKAKKMIEEEKGNVSEIAYSVGFSSPEYFSRCFKDTYGYPPSEHIR
jgi:signal transduction histidine kinase/ligand-binding sensor domain-containing protein/CheY-like chemotaxis protein/AraC-like DNA-binding protein